MLGHRYLCWSRREREQKVGKVLNLRVNKCEGQLHASKVDMITVLLCCSEEVSNTGRNPSSPLRPPSQERNWTVRSSSLSNSATHFYWVLTVWQQAIQALECLFWNVCIIPFMFPKYPWAYDFLFFFFALFFKVSCTKNDWEQEIEIYTCDRESFLLWLLSSFLFYFFKETQYYYVSLADLEFPM